MKDEVLALRIGIAKINKKFKLYLESLQNEYLYSNGIRLTDKINWKEYEPDTYIVEPEPQSEDYQWDTKIDDLWDMNWKGIREGRTEFYGGF